MDWHVNLSTQAPSPQTASSPAAAKSNLQYSLPLALSYFKQSRNSPRENEQARQIIISELQSFGGDSSSVH